MRHVNGLTPAEMIGTAFVILLVLAVLALVWLFDSR